MGEIPSTTTNRTAMTINRDDFSWPMIHITPHHGRIGRIWWVNSNQIFPKGSREIMWGRFGFDSPMVFRWEKV